MKFSDAALKDAIIIDAEKMSDSRGFFARTFCVNEFAEAGIEFNIVQCSISFNKTKGTLRGLHYQSAPHEESKIVRCTAGCIYDVVADIRPDSPTFKKWIALELSEHNHRAIYIPKGCAHGFQSLTDDAVVSYQMDAFFHPECACGIHHNDPVLNIDWPITQKIISTKDAELNNSKL